MPYFTHDHNTLYRRGVDIAPGPWIEYPEDLNHLQALERWFEKDLWIWDCDSCGEDTYIIMFDDETAYKLDHIYGWENWDNENRYVDNSMYHEKLDPTLVPIWMRKRRDWI